MEARDIFIGFNPNRFEITTTEASDTFWLKAKESTGEINAYLSSTDIVNSMQSC